MLGVAVAVATVFWALGVNVSLTVVTCHSIGDRAETYWTVEELTSWSVEGGPNHAGPVNRLHSQVQIGKHQLTAQPRAVQEEQNCDVGRLALFKFTAVELEPR